MNGIPPTGRTDTDTMTTATAAAIVHDTTVGKLKELLEYTSGEVLMAHGAHALHEHVAAKMEAALGRPLPQMDVRFRNLSLTAEIAVVSEENHADSSSKPELPTLTNELKKGFAAIISKKQSVQKEILKNVSGMFKPGTMTLVLGQPSSGKSSFMKILSGRFPMKKNIHIKGEITYNGQAQATLLKRLPQFVTYTTQRDNHIPTLTVKETLEFAHNFSGGDFQRRGHELLINGSPEQNAAALDATQALFEHHPKVVIEQLGLQNCQDTIVGDAMTRGVSGGERKRVTTGEMEFGMKYMTLMDEISTGLDSAATFDIINTQRSIARKLRKTVVIALLQPAPEVFALFDDVMILNEGEVMYHGPREQVVDYFESLGFKCPPGRDIADFLLDLGTKQQLKYNLGAKSDGRPRYPSEFADMFRRSAIHAEMLAALDAPYSPDLAETVKMHMDPMPEFHQSFWASTWTLIQRESMVNWRSTPTLIGRAVMMVIMGIIYAVTFIQFDPTNIQVVMGIVFAAVQFLGIAQMTLIPAFVEAREVFYRQRGANFFRTSSYVLANCVSQIPIALAETVVFGTMVYFICGFNMSVGGYLLFEAVLLLMNITFGAWYFFVAAITPNIHLSNPIMNFSLLFFILFAGFNVLRSQIPDYFIWIYWLTPISWGVRSIAVTEYRSSKYDVCEYGGVDYCTQFDGKTMGEYYLGLFDVQSGKEWIFLGVIYLVASYFLFMFLAYLVLEYKRYESPEAVSVSKKEADDEDETAYALVQTPKSSTPALAAFKDVSLAVRPEEQAFVPVALAFKDLWYSVPMPSNPKETIDLLKGITGYALPGTMTALMGSSGAGKTTLMDVIAGRKTGGKIQGKILLNGYEANDLAIRRCTGYCEQMDIHSEAATIREALTFSAFLRQDSSVPDSKKYDSVNECLGLLDLHDIADKIIRGSSVEQMKRLTIGVELAAQPSVLFLDEPTSGLDARSAKLVMDGVRKVANTGRTIVCTIHQPSSEVFYLFDNLLLLKRGGETVFFGDLGKGCRNLISYFTEIPGVEPLPKGYNPATWMLECIGAGVGNAAADGMDFIKYFNNSENMQSLVAEIAKDGVGHPAPGSSELIFTQKRAASSVTQMKFVVGRYFTMYWRTASFNLSRLFMSILLAVLFGLVFQGVDYASFQGVNSGIGMIFLVLIFNGLASFESLIPVVIHERASVYRERAAQTYSAFWYFFASTVAELPYVFASGLIFTVIFFPMVGFDGFWAAVLFWLNMSLMILYHAYLGHFLAYAFPNHETAAIIGVLVTSVYFLFMGFSPPTDAIPSGLKWLYYITPHTYSLSIFIALVFSNCPSNTTFDAALGEFINVGSELGCQPLKNAPVDMSHVTVKEFTEQVFAMKYDEIAMNFGIVIAFTVLFRILALLAMRFINHQKK